MPIDTSIKFVAINIALVTISDTRDLNNDSSGNILEKNINTLGHNLIIREIIKDDVSEIKKIIIKLSNNKEYIKTNNVAKHKI